MPEKPYGIRFFRTELLSKSWSNRVHDFLRAGHGYVAEFHVMFFRYRRIGMPQHLCDAVHRHSVFMPFRGAGIPEVMRRIARQIKRILNFPEHALILLITDRPLPSNDEFVGLS